MDDIRIQPGLRLAKPLTISLDYDGTASTHPAFWEAFVNMAKAIGYKVIIVTMRDQNEALEIEQVLLNAVDAVIATNRKAKQQFVRELGIRVDIWIDDMPQCVFVNADGTVPEPDASLATRLMHPDFGPDVQKALRGLK